MTGAIQDTSLRYVGSWATSRSSAWYGGTARVSSVKGAKVYQTVTARSVGLLAGRSRDQGKVQVYLDGKLSSTVDLSSARSARQIVWTAHWSSAGRHTVTVVNLATKGRPRMNVDALVTLV